MNAPQKMAPLPEEAQPTLEMVEQASQWHVQLHSNDAGDDTRAAFELWLKQHPAHSIAYKRLEALWGQFSGLEATPAFTALESTLKSGRSKIGKKSAVKAGMLGLVALIAGWLGMNTETAGYLMADYNTAIGEQRVVELDDSSRITLNTYSAIDVNYDGNQRHITLHKGEILIEVASDAERPFIVATPQGTARALGTRYVVKRESNATVVSVIESRVEACAAASDSYTDNRCVSLSAGQGTLITRDNIKPAMPIDTDAVSAWADGMLAVDNQPLAQVLRELERYRYGSIHFNSAEISELRVSGVFPLNDGARALEVLAGILPIRIKQYTPLLIVVEPE
jgi:transmembrane sensor